MLKSFLSLGLTAALLSSCVVMAPPPNRSANDPADPAAPEASQRRYRPNLVASTQVFLDPNVGKGAQKMNHGNMQMGGMEGMDHSKMQGMDMKQEPAGGGGMEGMDHSKMPGMGAQPQQQPAGSPAAQQQSGDMQGMDHSKMPGMASPPPASPAPQASGMEGMDHSKMSMPQPSPGASGSPASKEQIEREMKKTSDEMKQLSDEMKKKSDAEAKPKKKERSGKVTPTASPNPEAHQH